MELDCFADVLADPENSFAAKLALKKSSNNEVYECIQKELVMEMQTEDATPYTPHFAPNHTIHSSVTLKTCKTSSCFSSSPLQNFVFLLFPNNASSKFSRSRVYTVELFVASKLRLISSCQRLYCRSFRLGRSLHLRRSLRLCINTANDCAIIQRQNLTAYRSKHSV